MARKLKGVDFKQLMLKHGEKFMLAVVGLLIVVAFMGAKWVPFKPDPRDITNAVAKGDEKITSKTWPLESKKEFEVNPEASVQQLVAGIRQHVDPTPFEFTQPFIFDPYGTTSPITEPELHTVKSLVAEAGRRVIYVNPNPLDMDLYPTDEEMAYGAGETETQKAKTDDNIPDEFKSRDADFLPGTLADGLGLGYAPNGIAGEDGYLTGRQSRGGSRSARSGTAASRPVAGGTRGKQRRGGQGSPLDLLQGMDISTAASLYAGGGGAMNALQGLNLGASEDDILGGLGMGTTGMSGGQGRGVRYVAVRGVLPLKDQLRKIKKASNVSLFDAEQLYQIIDFELERQKMREHADNPWGDAWEAVSIDVAKEVLREAAEFAAETHEGQVSDSTITMPLPMCAMGVWGEHATHPQVKDFQLDDEQIKLEMEIQERLLKRYKEDLKNQPEELVYKKGFSDLQADSRSLMGSMRPTRGGANYYEEDEVLLGISGMGGGLAGRRFGVGNAFQQMDDTSKFLEEIEKSDKEKDQKELLLKYVKDHVGITGEMLLFRYLDFDVEPGETYRYRVRLQVTNPNYDRRSSEAAGIAEVVQGQTRWTEWSNLTEPARVPDDVDYFVNGIQTRGVDRVEANMTLFQWDPDVGTTVAIAGIKVDLGKEISGHEKPFVLDPAQNRFEQEDYEFQSGDVLVDAAQATGIDPKQHPDLQLPQGAKGRDLGISNQVLVVRSDGYLNVVDEKAGKAALADRKQRLVWEQKDYEDIKAQEVKQSQATGALDLNGDLSDLQSLYGATTSADLGMGGGGKDARSQLRSLLRRGGSGGGGGGRSRGARGTDRGDR